MIPLMRFTMNNKKEILVGNITRNFFSILFIFLYVFSFPVAVFSQTTQLDTTGIPQESIFDEGSYYVEPDWGRLERETQIQTQNTSIPAPRPQGRAETTYGSVGGQGIVDMNLLYPGSLPNNTNIADLEYVTDFASCIMGIMVVKYANVAIHAVAKLGYDVQEAIAGATKGSSSWHHGLLNVLFSGFSQEKVTNAKANVTHYGVDVFEIPVMPALEDMAFCAKNVLFAYISASVVKWVNEAVNGAAAWVESLSDQLTNVYALSYRKAIGEVNLCVDIELAVRVGIDLSFLKTQPLPPRGGCTISIAERHKLELMYKEGVYDPNLFAKVYSNPNNNAMGGFMLVDAAANTNAAWNEKTLLEELGWNNGFWPFKDQHGRTVTPGRFIEDKVINALNLETDHSFFANEWDRVIFMITNQIAKQEIGKAVRPLRY